MKITKRQLKRIIKEEKRKLLREQGEFGDETTDVRDIQPCRARAIRRRRRRGLRCRRQSERAQRRAVFCAACC